MSARRPTAFAIAIALAPILAAFATDGGPARAAADQIGQGLHRAAAGDVSIPPASTDAPKGMSRAPSGQPLAPSPTLQADGSSEAIRTGQGDPLVDNGLSSPLCEGPNRAALPDAARADCQISGFVAAAAPTKSYELDVHIDVGPFGLSKGGVLSVIQDVFITPLWNAVVWVVHALVVMLEWCYSFELLGGSMRALAPKLRGAEASFTQPWLAFVLVIASAIALYTGLIRRRVTETLGQALMALAMMSGGLWVIADPNGTVGLVGRWANQASLGTLGAVAQGTPAHASTALAESMRGLFVSAIEGPWCYLEFGDVRWCDDPRLLDPRLRKAASRLVERQREAIGCVSPGPARSCARSGSPGAQSIERSDSLIGSAKTNGALFLAFPANGPERNSVTEKGALLHVMCGGSDESKCSGPTAAQAEFRSDGGTSPRMIGVVLIALGVLGMVMLLGLVSLRLIAAAIVGLLVLLLAPFAVLAPALGDGGRAVFSAWTTRLLGAVSSKLLYSFLLGAILTMQRMLASLASLGWWTQWFLLSAFWWSLFLKRHQAAAALRGESHLTPGHRLGIARRTEEALRVPRAMLHPLAVAGRRVISPRLRSDEPPGEGSHLRDAMPNRHPDRRAISTPDGSRPNGVSRGMSDGSREERDGGGSEQAGQRSDRAQPGSRPADPAGGDRSAADYRSAKRPDDSLAAARPAGTTTTEARQPKGYGDGGPGQAQLRRVSADRETAVASGEDRRAALFAARERRIEAELAGEAHGPTSRADAPTIAAPPGAAKHDRGDSAGQVPGDPNTRQARRTGSVPAAAERAAGAERRAGGGTVERAGNAQERLQRELAAYRLAASRAARAAKRPPERQSDAMDDAWAVMEGRKRQLGVERDE